MKLTSENNTEVVEQDEFEAPVNKNLPLDNFDWDKIVNDVYTLWTYVSRDRHNAAYSVVESYRLEFQNRLFTELKKRSTAHWKEETYAKLKAEFEKKGK